MIPSSLTILLLFSFAFSSSVLTMELPRISSDAVHKRPQGAIPASSSMSFATPSKTAAQSNKSALPTSSSMAFPPAKKDKPDSSTLRGSFIKKMGRTASGFLGKRLSSGEIAPDEPKDLEMIPATQPTISAPLTTAILKAAIPREKKLILGKSIYWLHHYDEKDYEVKVVNTCKVYNVNSLKEFKSNNIFLQREEVLLFIAKHYRNILPPDLMISDRMDRKGRETAAKKVAKVIQKKQDVAFFNTPFYVVNFKNGGYTACAFEWELEEIKNNTEAV